MRYDYVIGHGPIPCRYMAVAEAPAKTECETGIPLTGRTGDEYTNLLSRYVGLTRDEIFTTNLFHYPLNDKKEFTQAEYEWQGAVLREEIEKVNPEVILSLGAISTHWFLGNEHDMEALNGMPHEWEGRIVVPSIHPAATFRDTALLSWVIEAFKCFKRIIDEEPDSSFFNRTSKPTRTKFSGFDGDMNTISIDTEALHTGEPYIVTFTAREGSAGYAYMDNSKVIKWLSDIVSDPEFTVFLHNALYDLPQLRKLGIYPHHWIDTMQIAFLLQTLPLGLKPLAYRLCRMKMRNYDDVVWGEMGIPVPDAKKLFPNRDLSDVPEDERLQYACLSKNSKVIMGDGSLRSIKNLVDNRSNEEVRSFNRGTNLFENKQITNWYRVHHKEKIKWVTIETEITRFGRWGSLKARYTPDHKILTVRGYIRADQLNTTDVIVTPYQSLNRHQKQVVVGSILGDGCLQKRNRTGWANLQISHCEKQREYLLWKTLILGNLLSSICQNNNELRCINNKWIQSSSFTQYTSVMHPELSELEKQVYKNKTKTIGSWVEQINPFGLAVWYQDDGTLVDKSSIRIYTLCFDMSDIAKLKEVLLLKFGLNFGHYHESRNGYPALTLNRVESHKFFCIIQPYMCNCMLYKLPPEYRDTPTYELSTFTNETSFPVYARITKVTRNESKLKTRGEYKTSYCIDTNDNHNFCTIGEVVHNCADADATLRVYNRMLPLWYKQMGEVLQRDMDIQPMIIAMMQKGMKIDVEYIEKLGTEFEVENLLLLDSIRDIAGEKFNPKSAPQVAELLYKKLKLGRGHRIDQTKWGGTTGAKTLKKIEGEHPIVGMIEEYRSRKDLKDKYIDVLPKYAQTDGRVHTNISMVRVAQSGRLASSSPNLLAQPVRTSDGRRIRDGFIAEEGYSIVSTDLNQIEMRLMAHCSQDPVLLSVYRNNGDVHTDTAMRTFNINDPSHVDELKHRYPSKRTGFGVIYRITARGLSIQLQGDGLAEWDEEKCQWLIDSWLREHFGVEDFWNRTDREVKRCGQISDMWGRMKLIPEVRSIFRPIRDAGLRKATNVPMQSGAQGIIKEAMRQIWDGGMQEWIKDGLVYPLIQIHDSLDSEVRDDFIHEYVDIVVPIMENVVELSIPIVAEPKVGKRWGSQERLNHK